MIDLQKGDLRKKQILETAEKLFCEKGYEKTSVQDILDVLKLSKGSFYHHYESKELVLRSICNQRASAGAEQYAKNADSFHGITSVNNILNAAVPFKGEGRVFLTMLLPVFFLPEGKSIRVGYQESIHSAYLPYLTRALECAYAEQLIYYTEPEETASICLDLVNDLWAKACHLLFRTCTDSPETAIGEVVKLTNTYRFALENLLNAPYGSLELLNLADLHELISEIRETIFTNQKERGGLYE